jgi:hypothetical protein
MHFLLVCSALHDACIVVGSGWTLPLFVHQRPATVVTFSFSDLLPSSISSTSFPMFDLFCFYTGYERVLSISLMFVLTLSENKIGILETISFRLIPEPSLLPLLSST